MQKKKIGIMGGTFDPIHIGHLILGEAAREQFSLDQIIFMPAGNPPHKKNRSGRATDAQRTEMVRLAISSNPYFELGLFEMNEAGYSYTYRTLEALQKQNPEAELYFIIGADSLVDFDTWKEPRRITKAATLVVAIRNKIDRTLFSKLIEERSREYDGVFLPMDTPNLDIASHSLRTMIQKKESVRYYIPDPVIEYIEKQQIYCRKQTD